MSGEQTQNEHRPRDHRPHDRQTGNKADSDATANNRNRNRRSGGGGGGRKSVYRFEDQLEHDICQLVTHQAPQAFPAIGRTELATMPPVEVARTESRILLCDRTHTGPHIWPNGDETGDIHQRSTVVIVESTKVLESVDPAEGA